VTDQPRPASFAPAYLSITESAQYAGVSRQTIWRWEKKHGLTVSRRGGVVRVRITDLEAFMQGETS